MSQDETEVHWLLHFGSVGIQEAPFGGSCRSSPARSVLEVEKASCLMWLPGGAWLEGWALAQGRAHLFLCLDKMMWNIAR